MAISADILQFYLAIFLCLVVGFPFHKDKIQSSEVQGGYRVSSDAVGHLHLCKLARNHKINDWTIECTEFSVCYHQITLLEYTYVS